MTPDKIYLAFEYSEIDVLPPGVTTRQAFGKDVCYIRKDALLEWAKEKMKGTEHSQFDTGYRCALKTLIDKLNSM